MHLWRLLFPKWNLCWQMRSVWLANSYIALLIIVLGVVSGVISSRCCLVHVIEFIHWNSLVIIAACTVCECIMTRLCRWCIPHKIDSTVLNSRLGLEPSLGFSCMHLEPRSAIAERGCV